MISRIVIVLSLALVGLAPFAHAETPAENAVRKTEVLARQVQAILKAKCLACHGDDAADLKGEFDLRSRTTMLRGGESGAAAVLPGKPDQSPLLSAIAGKDALLKMPPKENDALSSEQVELVRNWISAGAKWPDPALDGSARQWLDAAQGIEVATSGGRSPEWTQRKYQPADLWGYRAIARPTVPVVGVDRRSNAAAAIHPIDAFIQARLAAGGFTPAPPAEKTILLRRVVFDLTGLPPTGEQTQAFLADDSPPAFAKLIDDLLASPAYGEQQARHWLDVVRYADTSGLSNDYERPNAWRYRDYVIRSFNADKPFDQFVTEQLAGDEIEDGNPENLIAVGYLRMGPWEHTGMTVAAITRQDFLDDVTHHVGVSLLSQGLRCARCHDHKFDPVPTLDYYRIQAVFAPTQFAEREVPFLPVENTRHMAAQREVSRQHLSLSQQVIGDLDAKSNAAFSKMMEEKGAEKLGDLPPEKRPRRGLFGLTNEELSLKKIYQKRIAYFDRELKRYEPLAMSVYSGPTNGYTSVKPINLMPENLAGEIPIVHILPGGSLATPSEAVKPGVLSAMLGITLASPAVPPSELNDAMSGRRLALARWITSRENSLTARAIVNRVWQQHFGRGLVATANNFGKMGAKPTNLELLDWLATWLVDHDWSLKELHRLVLTSATYQQSGQHPDLARLQEADAKNELLAYYPQRRLAAEELRDSLLAISGELNDEMGGPGGFPEINWEVALQPRHIMGSVAPAYQPSCTPDERNRRTIYAFRYRTLADPLLEVFNRPGSETSCEMRDETTVTPQVFALFNGQFAHDRALALAANLAKEHAEPKAQIAAAFERFYLRQPSDEETQLALAHLQKMTAHHRQHPAKKTSLPQTVKRTMVEEMTGLDVSWDEALDLGEGYVRDLQPSDVSPSVQALADLCLVLINSNEFLYLR
jgi:mono/diheme cytochrome c family protein